MAEPQQLISFSILLSFLFSKFTHLPQKSNIKWKLSGHFKSFHLNRVLYARHGFGKVTRESQLMCVHSSRVHVLTHRSLSTEDWLLDPSQITKHRNFQVISIKWNFFAVTHITSPYTPIHLCYLCHLSQYKNHVTSAYTGLCKKQNKCLHMFHISGA